MNAIFCHLCILTCSDIWMYDVCEWKWIKVKKDIYEAPPFWFPYQITNGDAPKFPGGIESADKIASMPKVF